jgi:hypothetical protein
MRRGAELLGTVLLCHVVRLVGWLVGWLALIARGDRQCTGKVGTSPVDHPCLNRENRESSGARGSYLLELHDRRPGRAEQRALALTRGLADNIISESQVHRELGGHLYVTSS